MKAIDLDYQSFASWVAEEPSRSAKITIDSDHATVIVGQWLEIDGRREYVCQYAGTVAEIDLEGKFARQREKDQELRRLEYERMKAEFE